jgi:hypothetical protein
MRAYDLARLHRLQLIEDGKDGPWLTTAGRAVRWHLRVAFIAGNRCPA